MGVRICKKHGKPIATASDIAAWAKRTYCVTQGDCKCEICSRICWAVSCDRLAREELDKARAALKGGE